MRLIARLLVFVIVFGVAVFLIRKARKAVEPE
jgi:hypothetical protein